MMLSGQLLWKDSTCQLMDWMRMKRKIICKIMRIWFHFSFIVAEYWKLAKEVCSITMESGILLREHGMSTKESTHEDNLKTILIIKWEFEPLMSHIPRVKKDVLEIVFCSDDKESKPTFKALLERALKMKLVPLLWEFRDVFLKLC